MSTNTVTHQRSKSQRPIVTIYDSGGTMSAGYGIVGNPTGKGGGPRGKIKGWSIASRRRLRHFLLTKSLPSHWWVYGVTLTIPGDPMPALEAKSLFAAWLLYCKDKNWTCVWRMEVQKRGQIHYHAIVGMAPNDRYPHPDVGQIAIMKSWHHRLEAHGTYFSGTKVKPWGLQQAKPVYELESRMAVPGAHKYSVNVQYGEVSGTWKRYLHDHTSKSKQEQIPEDMGRHWGVVGRKHFLQAVPDAVCEMSPYQYAKFRRAYERLATPHRRSNGQCVFDWVLGRRRKSGRWGQSTVFTNPATLRRLVTWARSFEQ